MGNDLAEADLRVYLRLWLYQDSGNNDVERNQPHSSNAQSVKPCLKCYSSGQPDCTGDLLKACCARLSSFRELEQRYLLQHKVICQERHSCRDLKSSHVSYKLSIEGLSPVDPVFAMINAHTSLNLDIPQDVGPTYQSFDSETTELDFSSMIILK